MIAWELPMPRPDRTVLIVILVGSGLSLLHYTMYRVGRDPISIRPTNAQSFRQAISDGFRYLRASPRDMIVAASIVFLLTLSAYISGAELFMDWEEGEPDGRWAVHTANWIGGALAALSGMVQLTSPKRSFLGSLIHATSGMVVGGTAVAAAMCFLLGLLNLVAGAILAIPLGLPSGHFVACLLLICWSFLPIGVLIACWGSIGGLYGGCIAGWQGRPVYDGAFRSAQWLFSPK